MVRIGSSLILLPLLLLSPLLLRLSSSLLVAPKILLSAMVVKTKEITAFQQKVYKACSAIPKGLCSFQRSKFPCSRKNDTRQRHRERRSSKDPSIPSLSFRILIINKPRYDVQVVCHLSCCSVHHCQGIVLLFSADVDPIHFVTPNVVSWRRHSLDRRQFRQSGGWIDERSR